MNQAPDGLKSPKSGITPSVWGKSMKSIKIKLIAAALLMSSALSAAACGSEPGTSSQTPSGAPSDETEQTQDTAAAETEPQYPALPAADLGGREFRILVYTRGDPGTWFQYLDFGWSDELAGDLVNDAVMNRNMAVEEKYNVSIVSNGVTDAVATAKKSISAGSDDFDVFEPYCDSAYGMAGQGMLVNIYDLPHLELEADWWDKAVQRDLSLLGRLYVITGDASMFDEELSYVVYYNQALAKQFEIEDCYSLARDGKWTIGKMSELGRTVTHDLNGDGTLGDEDVYGVVTNYDVGRSWFFAMGGRMCTLDDNGDPKLTIADSHSQTAFEAISTMMNDGEVSRMVAKFRDSWDGAISGMKENRVLFLPGSLYDITGYRAMEDDFGVLPYPKLDESQDSYYNYVASHVGPVISVPMTNTDLDSTGLILEALARESAEVIVNNYIELNLMTKVARDDASAEMMRLIFATKRYDLACSYNWGKITNIVAPSCKDASTFQSNLAKLLPAAESDMQKTLDEFAG